MATARGALAQWLCDELGEAEETEHDFLTDADDLIEYMAAKNIVMVHSQYVTPRGKKILKAAEVRRG